MLSSANWKVYESWTCASGGYPAAKNIGKGVQQGTVTQYFWETLLEEGVAKTIQKPVSLLTFDLSVEVQFFMASSKKREQNVLVLQHRPKLGLCGQLELSPHQLIASECIRQER